MTAKMKIDCKYWFQKVLRIGFNRFYQENLSRNFTEVDNPDNDV